MKPYDFLKFLQKERGKTIPIRFRLKHDKESFSPKEINGLSTSNRVQYFPDSFTPEEIKRLPNPTRVQYFRDSFSPEEIKRLPVQIRLRYFPGSFASDEEEKYGLISFRIGKKVRTEKGVLTNYEDARNRLTPKSRRNLEDLSDFLNITWGDLMMYNSEGGITGFAVKGKDTEGREYLYDRRETSSTMAGQTILHSPNGRIQVSKALEMEPEDILDALKY